MKIIGKNKSGLLAEITEYELSALHGFNGLYDQGWKESVAALKAGNE